MDWCHGTMMVVVRRGSVFGRSSAPPSLCGGRRTTRTSGPKAQLQYHFPTFNNQNCRSMSHPLGRESGSERWKQRRDSCMTSRACHGCFHKVSTSSCGAPSIRPADNLSQHLLLSSTRTVQRAQGNRPCHTYIYIHPSPPTRLLLHRCIHNPAVLSRICKSRIHLSPPVPFVCNHFPK